MRRTPRSPTPRPGFTLVELMVAMALIILIMAILAGAFQVGMDTFSQLKSIGGLSDDLRAVQLRMTDDLSRNHLVDDTGNAVRVSDPRVAAGPWTGGGYFALTQRQQGTYEGADTEITSYRGDSEDLQTPGYCILRMAVQLSGRTPQDVFTADLSSMSAANRATLLTNAGSLNDLSPGGTSLVSRWAEVVYFVRPNGLLTVADSNTPGQQPLRVYTLYRRQRLLAANSGASIYEQAGGPAGSVVAQPIDYPDLSWSRVIPSSPSQDRLNTPTDITIPANRLGGSSDPTGPSLYPSPPLSAQTPPDTPSPAWLAHGGPGLPFPYRIQATNSSGGISARYGTDVLLNNVLSFQVSALTNPPIPPTAPAYSFGPYPSGYSPPPDAFPWTYDTANPPQAVTATGTAATVQLRAVQIKLRVYDVKNKITRQVTITQDL
jgi:type II secretory pathway pseudopilin PulG